jgi:hypothetical protein
MTVSTSPIAAHQMLDLSRHVRDIEDHLQQLDEALRGDQPLAIDAASQRLHKALADAVVAVRHARQAGQHDALPEALRRKLVLAQSRVAALQTSIHRAGSSIERTLGILMPPADGAGTYGAMGTKPSSAAALSAAYR